MDITFFLSNTSIYEWVIIAFYLIFFIIQLFYYLFLFRKPYLHADKSVEKDDTVNKSIEELPGMSIIITAKNEAENLRKNLPAILDQNYPNLQIVVVNNSSTDSTSDVLSEFCKNNDNLYVTYIPVNSESVNDKKLALTVGIKAAKHDILLFTEPDTKPLSDKWVYEYAKAFKEKTEVVIGCCQVKLDKSHLKKYILFDNLFSGVKYLSMALAEKPYMGIGRNMAFKKNLFFDNKGFSSVLNIEDGEDNVFVNRIATQKNTAVLISQGSMVVSNAIEGISSWRKIKLKYLSTQKHYKRNTTNILAFEVFSRFAFYLLFGALCAIGILSSMNILLVFAVIFFLIRYLVQIVVLNKNSRIYNSGKFYFSLPLLDLLVPINNYLFLNNGANRN